MTEAAKIVRTMVTPLGNDGLPQPHPPDYHAEITAEKIIVVAETASPEIQRAGRNLRKKVEEILLKHHSEVHDNEQAAIKEHGLARLDHDLETNVDDSILHEIIAASKGTILEPHFARQDVQDIILTELHHETRSQMSVHRQVFKSCDKISRQPKLVS